jgi:DNA helicase HerA-like ATPase
VDNLIQDAVLRIGEVCAVDGRRIYVQVDKNKNLSDMFLDGDILKNISVNSYIEIRKGFLSIIGRVEGERIEVIGSKDASDLREESPNKRILTVALSGYIDQNGSFVGGTRELPLIGDEAYIVTRRKIHLVHNLVGATALQIQVATIFGEDFDVELPVDGLFNSHIAIFGNTGSGKSNTLAILYQELLRVLEARNAADFNSNAHFVLFDFNGEYVHKECITPKKRVYNLSTRKKSGDKLPMSESDFLDLEVISILADATEKTQKPFLRRSLGWYRHVHSVEDPDGYLRNTLLRRVKDALSMSDKVRSYLLIDYFEEILQLDETGVDTSEVRSDLDWHNMSQEFRVKGTATYLQQSPESIEQTNLYKAVAGMTFPESLLARIILFLYSQLIADIASNRAQNEHIAPVINRLKAKRSDIDKIFSIGPSKDFWKRNFVVVNLDDVNLDMKKTLPLLLSKKLYSEQKTAPANTSLSIIIDEAHNILSTESHREAESWKDYRLETFEEIIKEGRKFGVFVTLSSQRPNDISSTITSQGHNYFIHRLINERDLQTIASAVSYIDRVTEESIPTLPTGTCVFSGVASQMPLKINIKPLTPESRPRSATRQFADIVSVEPKNSATGQ